MHVPQIRMTATMGKISIQQVPGRQEISQPKAELSIEQPKAELSIRTTRSKLTIDQSEAWEDMNKMSVFRRTEKFAQDGKQALQEGVVRRAGQGTELMRIENGSDAIVQQAMVNGHDQMKTLGITFIPSPFSVKIGYDPAEVQVDAQISKPKVNSHRNNVIHKYERGSVNIAMQQYSTLDIDFVNLFTK